MRDDRDPAVGAIAGDVAALLPIAGIAQGLLVGPLGDAEALHADQNAGVVHHREHAGHAVALATDQAALGAAVVAVGHHRRGRAVDAELVLDRGAAQVVAGAEAAIRIDQVLRHQEQADALGAGRRAGQTGEHHVNDVLRQIVLAVGDENLLAGDAVMLAVALGAGLQRADIGAGLRLGQVHGARPFAGDQLGQVERLLLLRAVALQELDGALGQQWAEREGHVGRLPHLLHGQRQGPGQALAAIVRIEGQGIPAALHEGPVSLYGAVRGSHHAVLEAAALLVACLIDGCQDLAGDLAGLREDRLDQIRSGFLEARKRRDPVEVGDLAQGEAHVIDGCPIIDHDP